MAYGLFITCLADTLAPEVGRATVTVLDRVGLEVEFPVEQTCCGQMHFNSGHVDEARLLARRFVEVFDGFEAIVTPSGSCAAHVRRHVPELVDDDRGVAGRTRELSEFLVERGGELDIGSSYRGSLAYHPTCHSLRLLRLGDRRSRCCGRFRASSSSSCRTPRSAAASVARSPSRTPTCRRRCSTRSSTA